MLDWKNRGAACLPPALLSHCMPQVEVRAARIDADAASGRVPRGMASALARVPAHARGKQRERKGRCSERLLLRVVRLMLICWKPANLTFSANVYLSPAQRRKEQIPSATRRGDISANLNRSNRRFQRVGKTTTSKRLSQDAAQQNQLPAGNNAVRQCALSLCSALLSVRVGA